MARSMITGLEAAISEIKRLIDNGYSDYYLKHNFGLNDRDLIDIKNLLDEKSKQNEKRTMTDDEQYLLDALDETIGAIRQVREAFESTGLGSTGSESTDIELMEDIESMEESILSQIRNYNNEYHPKQELNVPSTVTTNSTATKIPVKIGRLKGI